MVLHDYSEPQRLGLNMDAPCRTFGWPNTVVWGRAPATYYPEHLTPLSLRTVFSGQEVSEVGRARFAVTPECYLLLNEGQRHAHAVEEGSEVLLVMFQDSFARGVLKSLVTPADRLLDDPSASGESVHFFERTYPHDAALTALLRKLRTAVTRSIGQGALESLFQAILERLLQLHRNLISEVAKLPAVRHATRVELYRRLHLARDFMDASFTGTISLEQVAAVAELSPYHLLRLFKKSFGETPHQYLTRKRLERAKRLLSSGGSVTDVCFDVGFESLGSFSWLFKRRTGVSPSTFRKAQFSRSNASTGSLGWR